MCKKLVVVLSVMFLGFGIAYSMTWDKTNVDSVGTYTAIAVDSMGNPHISYYNNYVNPPLTVVKHAWYDGTWHTEVIDSVNSYYCSVGGQTAIAMDSKGFPHIAYVRDTMVGSGKYKNFLKYAYQDAKGWHISRIDSTLYADPLQDPDMEIDSQDKVHIAFRKHWYICYGYYNGDSWKFDTLDIDNSNSNGPPSIALNKSGVPYIAYHTRGYDGDGVILSHSPTWAREYVDSFLVQSVFKVKLAIDSQDKFHVTYIQYFDSNKRWHIMLARWTGTDWNIIHVDSTYSNESDNISIAVDSQGREYIPAMGLFDFRLFYYTGSIWETSTIIDSGVSQDAGSMNDIKIDKFDNLHISSAGSLFYAKGSLTPVEERTANKIGELKAFPNPFCYSTAITGMGKQKVEIYNACGQFVGTLQNGMWNGTDINGKEVPKGIYFIKVRNNRTTETLKLIKLK